MMEQVATTVPVIRMTRRPSQSMHRMATIVSTKFVSPTYTACCTDKLVLDPV
jgi:hypothetical protein